MSASFDLDYELDDLQSGALDWVFGYDDTGNILSIADQAIPANDQRGGPTKSDSAISGFSA